MAKDTNEYILTLQYIIPFILAHWITMRYHIKCIQIQLQRERDSTICDSTLQLSNT
jgi:hypothetical protein